MNKSYLVSKVHILGRLLNFCKLALNLPSYKPTIKDEGSIIIISNEDYLYIRFLSDSTNFLMSITYQKPRCKEQNSQNNVWEDMYYIYSSRYSINFILASDFTNRRNFSWSLLQNSNDSLVELLFLSLEFFVAWTEEHTKKKDFSLMEFIINLRN